MLFKKFIPFLFFLFSFFSLYARPGYFEPWGKDSDLKYCLAVEKEPPPKKSLGVYLAGKIIDFHQKVISPIDGPRSHFRPSSSEYMRLAIQKYGFLKGFAMGCNRLLRENSDPWVYRQIESEGKLFKYDPP